MGRSSASATSEGRLAPELLDEFPLGGDQLVDPLCHVNRGPDRPRLVGDPARDRFANPPGGIRRELEAAAVVELLDGTD